MLLLGRMVDRLHLLKIRLRKYNIKRSRKLTWMSKNFEFLFQNSCTYITLNHFLGIIHWAFRHDLVYKTIFSWTVKTSQLLNLIRILSLNFDGFEIIRLFVEPFQNLRNRTVIQNDFLAIPCGKRSFS